MNTFQKGVVLSNSAAMSMFSIDFIYITISIITSVHPWGVPLERFITLRALSASPANEYIWIRHSLKFYLKGQFFIFYFKFMIMILFGTFDFNFWQFWFLWDKGFFHMHRASFENSHYCFMRPIKARAWQHFFIEPYQIEKYAFYCWAPSIFKMWLHPCRIRFQLLLTS